MKHYLSISMIIFILPIFIFSETHTIKMATIAPEGSSWMNIMHQFDEEIGDLTKGQIKFKIYPNGVQGDELNMIRKMKLGQIHSASFTGVGLGEIVPEVRILDVPFLFKNKQEVEYIYNVLFEELQQKFIKKGFFIVGFAEVGFIYLFTENKINTLQDLQNTKMWLWKTDPLARTAFDILNIPAIPLDITDVYTSLQTGLVNGFYISPYGALALQWFTHTQNMLSTPLTHSIGAVLITTKKLNSIPKESRQIFIEKTREYLHKIIIKGRNENRESIIALREAGVQISPANQLLQDKFDKAGIQTREKMVGKLYSKKFLDKVINLLEEYRLDEKSD